MVYSRTCATKSEYNYMHYKVVYTCVYFVYLCSAFSLYNMEQFTPARVNDGLVSFHTIIVISSSLDYTYINAVGISDNSRAGRRFTISGPQKQSCFQV